MTTWKQIWEYEVSTDDSIRRNKKELKGSNNEKRKKRVNNQGKKMPDHIKIKISQSNKGRKISPETIMKNSQSHKGKGILGKNNNAKPIKCNETGKIYGCIKELAKELNLKLPSLYTAIRKNKKYKNLTFEKEKNNDL